MRTLGPSSAVLVQSLEPLAHDSGDWSLTREDCIKQLRVNTYFFKYIKMILQCFMSKDSTKGAFGREFLENYRLENLVSHVWSTFLRKIPKAINNINRI